MYERDWTVRFGDVDTFGIGYYPAIIDAVHVTADMYLESIEWPLWRLIDDNGLGLPIVEMGADFERPVELGEVVTIELEADLGNSSLRFEYTGVDSEGDTRFTAFEQRVCLPVDGGSSVDLPDGLRDAIEASRD